MPPDHPRKLTPSALDFRAFGARKLVTKIPTSTPEVPILRVKWRVFVSRSPIYVSGLFGYVIGVWLFTKHFSACMVNRASGSLFVSITCCHIWLCGCCVWLLYIVKTTVSQDYTNLEVLVLSYFWNEVTKKDVISSDRYSYNMWRQATFDGCWVRVIFQSGLAGQSKDTVFIRAQVIAS